ncbi:MAG: HDOD domain-containing protein [Bryobacteraceae bacterium]
MVPLTHPTGATSSLAGPKLPDESAHETAWRSRTAKETALKAISALPPFSPILNKLMATLADENVSFTQVAALIEKDTVVAGNILHLVNSALYARRGTINSVGHALSILGIVKLRNAVLGMSISKMWTQVRTPASWSMARFNMHSVATAILCDLLAQRVPVEYPEGAFIAGLMHDIGRLLIAIGLPAESNTIANICPYDSVSYETEQQVLGFTHTELSADALRVWKLPEPIQIAVRDHHTAVSREPNGAIPLSELVMAASAYVNGKGIGISLRNSPPPEDPFGHLSLSARQQETTIAEFATEYEAILPFFK